MVKILTLERENSILVWFGMDFSSGGCLFVCLSHLSSPYLAQILLRFLIRRYQGWGMSSLSLVSNHICIYFFAIPGLPVMFLILSRLTLKVCQCFQEFFRPSLSGVTYTQ